MKGEYKDFIGVYKNVYPEGYCEHLISEFERLIVSGAGANRKQSENIDRHKKDDLQLELNLNTHTVSAFENKNSINMFFNGLQQCYDEYSDRYSVLKDCNIYGTAMKMQRTDPGGGYHVWHGEQGSGENSRRVLVYLLYLNTLEDDQAGETEFLYQQRRIKPLRNTIVITPASFTHAHRGNVVYGNKSKYIITGWFYYDK